MKVKKIIGIFFLIAGIIGFFVATEKKYDQAIFEETIINKERNSFEISLEAGQTYNFKFWGEDSDIKANAINIKFIGDIKIYNQKDQLLFDRTLIADHSHEFAERLETKGELEYLHTPKFSESIRLVTEIKEGEKLTIEVFKNLDSETDAFPGVFIIVAVIGIFIVLSSRKKSKN